MDQQSPFLIRLLKAFFNLVLIAIAAVSVWFFGVYFEWRWGDLIFNSVSSLITGVVVGFIVYLAFNRPIHAIEEQERRRQCLAILKNEYKTNLERVRKYQVALKNPENNLGPLYPFHLTRGAWDALRDGGYLPHLKDVSFVVELLRVNEIIVIANATFVTIIEAHVAHNTEKLNRYAYQARFECNRIETLLVSIIAKMDKMNLPKAQMDDVPAFMNSSV